MRPTARPPLRAAGAARATWASRAMLARGARRLAGIAAGAAVVALAGAPIAHAHGRSLSYSSWELAPDGARIQARLTALDLSRLNLPADPEQRSDPVAAYIGKRLLLLAGDQPCPPVESPMPMAAASGWAVYEWRVVCPPGEPHAMRSDLLLAENPSHLHFARARLPDGQVVERVLAEADRWWPLPRLGGSTTPTARAGDGGGTTFPGYLALGVEHILSGYDHLAFVVALLLLARTLGEVATLVTAFTVAHSVTLGLATLGVVRPEATAVEALIGFSIALVAAENAWLLAGRDRWIPAAAAIALVTLALLALGGTGAVAPLALLGLGVFSLCHFALLDRARSPGRLRAAVAFAFGLVHGFGFAGVLAEMDLPRQRLVAALLGFNVGVEIGQLAVVALVWPLLRLIGRFGGAALERLVAETASAAICGLGLFLFLSRALG